MFYTSFLVVRDEGPLALYRGVTAAVARGMLYGGRHLPMLHVLCPRLHLVATSTTPQLLQVALLEPTLCRNTTPKLVWHFSPCRLENRTVQPNEKGAGGGGP